MKLVYYLPHALYNDKIFVNNEVEIYKTFSQMFNPSISLIDRSKSIKCPPIEIKNLYPFAEWGPTQSFDELSFSRFDNLLSTAMSLNKKLIIFYSGGIDSTLIAALALSHPNFNLYKDQIYIAYNEESIKENYNFYQQYLLPNFQNNLISSNGYYSLIADDNNMCITGEFADNIFGSLTLKSYMDNTGDFAAIHKPFLDTGLQWLLKKIKNTEKIDHMAELLLTIINQSPRKLISNHDCFWWLNFVLKWQAVKFRLASHAPSPILVNKIAKNVIHFFDTYEFQNWAVNTEELKVDNDWYSYKMPAKKIIYDINKDDYYFKWKTKYPSIPGLTRYGNTHNFIYLTDNNEYIASKDLL